MDIQLFAAPTGTTKILGLNDMKIFELEQDDATALTYATATDVPGAVSLQISPTFIEKDLRGDEKVLDKYSKLDTIGWSFSNVLMSLDALAVLIGGTVAESGVTPAAKKTYSLLGADIAKYFKLEGQSLYTDAGDIHLILYKCKASSVQYELRGEEYATVTASGTAIATINSDKIKDIVINETAEDIE
jgi:hypothetical protein